MVERLLELIFSLLIKLLDILNLKALVTRLSKKKQKKDIKNNIFTRIEIKVTQFVDLTWFYLSTQHLSLSAHLTTAVWGNAYHGCKIASQVIL